MGPISAVIVAGGKGERMGADTPKQYLMLDALPVLTRTLLAFAEIPDITAIFLVVPKSDFDFCRNQVIQQVRSFVPIELVGGGAHRQQSVYNGLSAINDHNGIVIIHDGVRPFFPINATVEAIRIAETEGGCILGIPAVDTLKNVDPGGHISKTVVRAGIWQAQTPQVFQYRWIKKAHDHALSTGYIGTDDASLMENIGLRVKIIKGSPYNIKITTPDDLMMAHGILSQCRR